MLTDESRLEIAEQDVAAKVMDGEAIIINVANGYYYTLGGAGGEMWELIRAGWSLGAIADELADRHGISRSDVADDLEGLATELLDEGLVAVRDEAEEGGMPQRPAPDDGDHARPPSYESPELHAYRDMAELLALDPPMPGLADPAGDGPSPAGERT